MEKIEKKSFSKKTVPPKCFKMKYSYSYHNRKNKLIENKDNNFYYEIIIYYELNLPEYYNLKKWVNYKMLWKIFFFFKSRIVRVNLAPSLSVEFREQGGIVHDLASRFSESPEINGIFGNAHLVRKWREIPEFWMKLQKNSWL